MFQQKEIFTIAISLFLKGIITVNPSVIRSIFTLPTCGLIIYTLPICGNFR